MMIIMIIFPSWPAQLCLLQSCRLPLPPPNSCFIVYDIPFIIIIIIIIILPFFCLIYIIGPVITFKYILASIIIFFFKSVILLSLL